MDTNDFKLALKSGSFSGVYIFAGEEEYLIRYYLKALRDAIAIDEAFAVFNNPVFDGEEIDFGAIGEAVKSPPMMSDYKLIEWRHADFNSLGESGHTQLEELISLCEEHSYSIVALTASGDGLDFGTQNKPSAFVKKFGKRERLNILRFEKSTENQLYAWLKKHFDSHGVNVTLDTVKALVFRSGRSMDVLAKEVEKLSALAHARGKKSITPDDVSEVASSTPECDTFALSNAILERSRQKAYFALEEMKIKRVDPIVAMSMVARTFDDLTSVAHLLDEGRGLAEIKGVLNMNEYKLKIYINAAKRYGADRLSKIVESLARADSGAKFGGVTGYTAVELFISQNL